MGWWRSPFPQVFFSWCGVVCDGKGLDGCGDSFVYRVNDGMNCTINARTVWQRGSPFVELHTYSANGTQTREGRVVVQPNDFAAFTFKLSSTFGGTLSRSPPFWQNVLYSLPMHASSHLLSERTTQTNVPDCKSTARGHMRRLPSTLPTECRKTKIWKFAPPTPL